MEEGQGELNLVPYLDIMVNLIVFLIFTFQIIVDTRVVELIAPGTCATCPSGERNATASLAITEAGYTLLSDDPRFARVELPRVAGAYDVAALRAELARWRSSGRFGADLTVVAERSVRYSVLVEAMDAAREDGDQPLFPSVRLARPTG